MNTIGDFIELHWEHGSHPEYIRGHVSARRAHEVIEIALGADALPVSVVHRYARWQFPPAWLDSDRHFVAYDAPGHGCFAVTECEPLRRASIDELVEGALKIDFNFVRDAGPMFRGAFEALADRGFCFVDRTSEPCLPALVDMRGRRIVLSDIMRRPHDAASIADQVLRSEGA